MTDFPRQIIDALTLSESHRALLRPGEAVQDDSGRVHHLPRFFYIIHTWADAHATRVAQHFKLAELITVDCREADLLLHEFPHYVPCAVTLLAMFLEGFRRATDAPVFVSANGGYRSPAHQRSALKSTHCWSTAADIYRIADTFLDNEKSIRKFGALAQSLGADVFVQPYAEGDDHLHVDLGFVTVTPRDCSER